MVVAQIQAARHVGPQLDARGRGRHACRRPQRRARQFGEPLLAQRRGGERPVAGEARDAVEVLEGGRVGAVAVDDLLEQGGGAETLCLGILKAAFEHDARAGGFDGVHEQAPLVLEGRGAAMDAQCVEQRPERVGAFPDGSGLRRQVACDDGVECASGKLAVGAELDGVGIRLQDGGAALGGQVLARDADPGGRHLQAGDEAGEVRRGDGAFGVERAVGGGIPCQQRPRRTFEPVCGGVAPQRCHEEGARFGEVALAQPRDRLRERRRAVG